MLENKKILIFDLGGVLIDLHVERSFDAFAHLGVDRRCLSEGGSPMNSSIMQFDRGDIAAAEMFGRIASFLPEKAAALPGKELEKRLAAAWNLMLGEFAPCKFRRLRELRERGYRVLMLSNTNELHWPEIERKFKESIGEPIDAFFDSLYLSFRMNLRKPEREIFLELLSSECADAADCIFFDDSAANCEAARLVGIDAVLMERNAEWSDSIMTE